MMRNFAIGAWVSFVIAVAGFVFFSYADGGFFCTLIDGTNPPPEEGFDPATAMTDEELASDEYLGIASQTELEEKRKCFARSRKAKEQRLAREEAERMERHLQRNRELSEKLMKGFFRQPAPKLTEEQRRRQEAQEQLEKLERLERRVKELEEQVR